MRRIFVSSAVAVLAASVFFSVAADRSAAQSKAKAAKGGTAAAPAYGNSDAISQDELKVYDYFLASDTLEGRNFPSAAMTRRRFTWPATWPNGTSGRAAAPRAPMARCSLT